MDKKPTFMDLFRAGKLGADSVDDYVNEWADNKTENGCENKSLQDFLGMTDDEYADWCARGFFPDSCVAKPDNVSEIPAGSSGHLKITWLTDTYDCDDCGLSYADGAVVMLNGKPLLDMTPHAHCYNGTSYETSAVYKAVLKKLGYQVEEESCNVE